MVRYIQLSSFVVIEGLTSRQHFAPDRNHVRPLLGAVAPTVLPQASIQRNQELPLLTCAFVTLQRGKTGAPGVGLSHPYLWLEIWDSKASQLPNAPVGHARHAPSRVLCESPVFACNARGPACQYSGQTHGLTHVRGNTYTQAAKPKHLLQLLSGVCCLGLIARHA